jgi:hypothetical protein
MLHEFAAGDITLPPERTADRQNGAITPYQRHMNHTIASRKSVMKPRPAAQGHRNGVGGVRSERNRGENNLPKATA